MAFCKGIERLANRSSPYTKREAGVNEPTPFLTTQAATVLCQTKWKAFQDFLKLHIFMWLQRCCFWCVQSILSLFLAYINTYQSCINDAKSTCWNNCPRQTDWRKWFQSQRWHVYGGNQHQNLTRKIPFKSCVRHYFCKGLQLYNSPADWARELFKPSTDSASLLVEIVKFFFSFWVWGSLVGTSQVRVLLRFFGRIKNDKRFR